MNKSATKTIFLRKQNVLAADMFTFAERNSLEFFEKFEHWEERKNRLSWSSLHNNLLDCYFFEFLFAWFHRFSGTFITVYILFVAPSCIYLSGKLEKKLHVHIEAFSIVRLKIILPSSHVVGGKGSFSQFTTCQK